MPSISRRAVLGAPLGADGYGGSADAQEVGTAPVPAAQATAAYHRQFWAADIARWRPVIEAASAYAD